MLCKHIYLITFLNEDEVIFFVLLNGLTQLYEQTVLFQTIPFSIIHLFAHSLNVKQLYLTDR